MSLFQLEKVDFSYGKQSALREISLQVRTGERIAVLGANGSGKSTLLRLLAGLAYPDRGKLSFDGATLTENSFEDLAFATQFRRRVQLVFQNADAQLFCPTVEDEVAFGPMQLGLGEAETRSRIDEALLMTGTVDLRDRSPHRLSGGEKKRVALAAVMSIRPEVLLLDEPTASLDPRTQAQIVDFLAGPARATTQITVTHDLHLVPELADRCLVFAGGSLVADGPVDLILGNQELLEQANLTYRRR